MDVPLGVTRGGLFLCLCLILIKSWATPAMDSGYLQCQGDIPRHGTEAMYPAPGSFVG